MLSVWIMKTYLNPYEIFQQFKLHPLCKQLLKKGQRIAYGARALTEGGGSLYLSLNAWWTYCWVCWWNG